MIWIRQQHLGQFAVIECGECLVYIAQLDAGRRGDIANDVIVTAAPILENSLRLTTPYAATLGGWWT